MGTVVGTFAWTAILCLACSCSASAETITVDIGGSGDYLSIQEGLDAATYGDTVLVCPGVYHEHLVMGPSTDGVTLLGESGPEFTVVTADSIPSGPVLWCEGVGPETRIVGLTIRASALALPGAGIHCEMGTSLQILGNIIEDCWSKPQGCSGGAIATARGDVLIEGNIIRNNRAGEGGGISLWGGSTIVRGNRIEGNRTDAWGCTESGGGIHIVEGTHLIEDNVIVGNYSLNTGGAIRAIYWGTSVSLMSNTITGNSSYDGCGGLSVADAFIDARGNVFSGNHSATDAAAISFFGTGSRRGSVFEDNVIFGNTSTTGVAAVVVRRDQAPVFHSNFLVNPTPYEVCVKEASSPDTLDFTGNWWGFTNASSIDARIWDSGDDPEVLVRVDFSDWCVEPECGGSATSVPDGDRCQPTSWGHIKSLFRE